MHSSSINPSPKEDLSIELDNILKKCESAKEKYHQKYESSSKNKPSPQLFFKKKLWGTAKELQKIHDRLIKEKITFDKEDSQQVIDLFNKVANAVNSCLPKAQVALLPATEVLHLEHDPNFQNLSEVEKEFVSALKPVNLGHLIGDSFILHMVDRWGNPVEGNSIEASIDFWLKALDFLVLKHPQRFEGKEKDLEKAKQQLLKAKEIGIQLGKVVTSSFKEDSFKMFVERRKAELEGLKEGESILMPWGWSDPNKHGHAMLLNFTRRDGQLHIEVINTGSGLQFHQEFNRENASKPFRYNTISHYCISAERESDFFKQTLSCLFEPHIVGQESKVNSRMHNNALYTAEELYFMLEDYKMPRGQASPQTELLGGEQQSGTCSFKCTQAFMGKQLGGEFAREIKYLWEQEVCNSLLQFSDFFLQQDPIYEVYLSRLNPNLFRRAEKHGKLEEQKAQIEKFEEQGKQIDVLLTPVQETNPSLPPHLEPKWWSPVKLSLEDAKERTQKIESKKDTSEINKLHQKARKKELISLPIAVGDLATSDPKTILGRLTQFLEMRVVSSVETRTCSTHEDLWKVMGPKTANGFHLAEQVRQLSLFFADPAYDEQRKVFLANLKEHPALVKEYLAVFAKLLANLNQDPLWVLDISYCVALEGMRLAIYDIGVLEDDLAGREGAQRLDAYGLKFNMDLSELGLPNLTFNSPQSERDFEIVKAAFARRFHDRQSVLFDYKAFSSGLDMLRIGSASGFPNFTYAESFFEGLSMEQKEEIHEAFLLESRGSSNLSESSWNRCYLAAKAKDFLPASYAFLEDISKFSITQLIEGKYKKGSKTLKIEYDDIYLIPGIETKSQKACPPVFPGIQHVQFDKRPWKRDTNNFPIFAMAQNFGTHLNPKLKEVSAILSLNHEMQIPTLLNYYRERPALLLEKEHLMFFEIVLFSPLKISTAIKANPKLASDVAMFFEEINMKLSLGKLNLNDPREVGELKAIMLEQKCHLYQILDSLGQTENLQAVREEIKTSLKGNFGDDPAIRVRLLFALIGTYSNEAWEKDEINSILKSFHEALRLISSTQCTDLLAVSAYLRSSKLIMENLPVIVNFINHEESRSLVESLAGEKVLEWKLKDYPLITMVTEKGTLEANLVTGDLLAGTKGLKQLVPENLIWNDKYKLLFGGKRIVGEDCGSYYSVEHPSGHYTLWPSIFGLSIEKRIDGQRHLLYTKLNLGDIPDAQNWQPWVNLEDDQAPILILDKAGVNKLGHIEKDGTIQLYGPPKASVRYSRMLPWVHPFFETVGPCLWTEMIDDKGIKSEGIQTGYCDRFNNPLEFVKTAGKWCLKNDPSYWIASDQTLKGAKFKKKYLILINQQGKKIVLVPDLTAKELGPKEKKTEETEDGFQTRPLFSDSKPSEEPGKLLALDLDENGNLGLQNSAEKNAFACYHLLMRARTPKDYAKALEFLQSVREFRAFSDQELKFLGRIVFSNNEKKCDDPEAIALRLMAAYLLYDNLNHYPQESEKAELAKLESGMSVPKATDGEDIWANFIRQKLKEAIGVNTELRAMALAYHKKRNNLSRQFKIENWISPHELERWGFNLIRPQGNQTKVDIEKAIPLAASDHLKSIPNLNARTKKPIFLTRFDKNFGSGHFVYYYKLASSAKPEDRREVMNFLQKSRFTEQQDQRTYFSILVAALEASDPESPCQEKAKEYIKEFEEVCALSREGSWKLMRARDTASFLYSDFKIAYEKANQKKISRQTIQRSKPLASRKIPQMPEKPRVLAHPYAATANFYDAYQQIGKPIFTSRQSVEEKPEQLFPEVNENVKWLNEEYAAGYQQNLSMQKPALLISSKEAREELLTKKAEIEQLHKRDLDELSDLGQRILEKGNYHLKTSVKARAKVGGGKKRHLNIDDLLLLALRNDANAIRKATGLKSEQKELIDLIGRYLEVEMRSRHGALILTALNELEKSDAENCLDELNALQDLLQAPYALVKHHNPLIQLTFQHFIGLNFREDQVLDLEKMIEKGSDIFIQKATGGGKTLVLAHMLAYYKADGYHLSIHVSPTYQFASQIYEMSERSQRALSQKARDLKYHDTPEYFNEEYLKQLHEDLIITMDSGGYFNTTTTTLRTLQVSYIHSALEYYNNPSLTSEERKSLEPKKDAVRKVNATIRDRGIITFDEVHDAMNPKTILNKGVGETTTLDRVHMDLMSSLLLFGIETKKASGEPLAAIKENRQAGMTPEDKEMLAEAAVDMILGDVKWLKKFGCETLNKSELEALKNYLLNKDAPMPAFIEERIKSFSRKGTSMTPLDHLLLCRQLIAGRWLFDSLSQSVYEHHGIVYEEGRLPISIPFTANLKPSRKSEFSDPYRMGINTLIAYHVQGITLDQTAELIEALRNQAAREFEKESEKNPDFQLENTQAFKQFKKMMKEAGQQPTSLIEINLKDRKTLAKVQTALRAPSHAALSLLSNYVVSRVLKGKTLFTAQVSCNGMNTAAMGKHINGFSATLDNKHMAPLMDFSGRKAELNDEKGIYGQRVDVMRRKHRDVYVMGDEPENLFTDVYQNLSKEEKGQVRAIIDAGCHFCGLQNDQVAKMMCEQFKDTPIEGVVFYDIETDRPYFMYKSNPSKIVPIKSFKIKEKDGEKVFEDLDIPVDKVAVYYSQDKITGTDIPLMKDAIAISTFTKTPFFKKMQGDGRMRQMNKDQRIVTAIQKSALQPMSELLQKPELKELDIGKADQANLIDDVILFSHCYHAKGKKEESFLLCMQNLQGAIRTYLLDKIYQNPSIEKHVFTKCAHLFQESLALDFVHEYGLPKTPESMQAYLESFQEHLMSSLEELNLPNEEVRRLGSALIGLISEHLPDLEKTILVHPGELEKGALSKGPRDGTMVQVQEKKATNVQEQMNIQEWIQESSNRNDKMASRTQINAVELFSHVFPDIKDNTAGEAGGRKLPNMDDFGKEFHKFLQRTKGIYRSRVETIATQVMGDNPSYTATLMDLCEIMNRLKDECQPKHKQMIEEMLAPFQTSVGVSFSSLNQTLKEKYPQMWESEIFSDNLVISPNFISTIEGGINILDPYQKPLMHLLLIKEGEQFKLLILSAEDAQDVAKAFDAKAHALPAGRQMWLINPQGNQVWPGPSEYSREALLESPEVRKLLIQANFFAGNVSTLESATWQKAFNEWVATVENPALAKSFFEEGVLKINPFDGYQFTKTYITLAKAVAKQ